MGKQQKGRSLSIGSLREYMFVQEEQSQKDEKTEINENSENENNEETNHIQDIVEDCQYELKEREEILSKNLEDLEVMVDELKTEKNNAVADHIQLKDEYNSLQNTHISMTQKNEELQEEKNFLKNEIRKLVKDSNDLEDKNNELIYMYKGLEEKNKMLKEKYEQSESYADSVCSTSRDMHPIKNSETHDINIENCSKSPKRKRNKELKTLQKNLIHLKDETEKKDFKIAQLKRALENKKTEQQILESKTNALGKDYEEVCLDLSNTNDMLRELNEEFCFQNKIERKVDWNNMELSNKMKWKKIIDSLYFYSHFREFFVLCYKYHILGIFIFLYYIFVVFLSCFGNKKLCNGDAYEKIFNDIMENNNDQDYICQISGDCILFGGCDQNYVILEQYENNKKENEEKNAMVARKDILLEEIRNRICFVECEGKYGVKRIERRLIHPFRNGYLRNENGRFFQSLGELVKSSVWKDMKMKN